MLFLQFLEWNMNSYSPCFSTIETHGRSDVGCERSFQLCDVVLESFVASGQFVEKLLVECVALCTTARQHENVTSNELMNNFAVGGDTAESNIDVAFKLYGHLEESKTHTHKNSIDINAEFLGVKKYCTNVKLQMVTKYNVDVILEVPLKF